MRFRAFRDPLPGFVPPLASLYALRRRAVPMRSFVRSNSGSGLAANRRNRITPRAPILPLTEFSVFLNQRSTKDPHPPSSHSPVGVAGDFWLGSRFRSPTGSTKNCQRTRLVLRLAGTESTQFCRFVSRWFSICWHELHTRLTDFCACAPPAFRAHRSDAGLMRRGVSRSAAPGARLREFRL